MRSSVERVYVAGIGACTALGRTAASSAAAVRAGIVRFAPHPHVLDRAGEPLIVARASYLGEGGSFAERCLGLWVPASAEALAPLRGGSKRAEVPVIVGVPSERPGWPAALAASLTEQLARQLAPTIDVRHMDTVASGHAAGLRALERGWRRVRDGETDWTLVGGADSYIHHESLEWFDEQGMVHSGCSTGGFVPGEGAGFCLLGSRRALERWSVTPLAEVVSVAVAHEMERSSVQGVCTGRGLTEAAQRAFAGLPDEVRAHEILCDLNGDPRRTDEFGFTLTRLSERLAGRPALLSPAANWGDVGAASGPLLVGLATAAFSRGYARGPHVLLSTSGDGGERCVAVLGAPAHRREGTRHAPDDQYQR